MILILRRLADCLNDKSLVRGRSARSNRAERQWRFCLALLGLSAIGIACEPQARTVDAPFRPLLGLKEVANLAGEKVPVVHPPDAKAVVLLFLDPECPISNRYAPELRRLHTKFAPQHVSFRLVYPGSDTSEEDVRRHAREFSLPGEPLRDPRLALARAAGVRVTPEAVVVLPNARIAYRGRIDDQFPDLNAQRPAPTRRDLEEALQQILAGQPVAHPETKAVGCIIQGLP